MNNRDESDEIIDLMKDDDDASSSSTETDELNDGKKTMLIPSNIHQNSFRWRQDNDHSLYDEKFELISACMNPNATTPSPIDLAIKWGESNASTQILHAHRINELKEQNERLRDKLERVTASNKRYQARSKKSRETINVKNRYIDHLRENTQVMQDNFTEFRRCAKANRDYYNSSYTARNPLKQCSICKYQVPGIITFIPICCGNEDAIMCVSCVYSLSMMVSEEIFEGNILVDAITVIRCSFCNKDWGDTATKSPFRFVRTSALI